jgi:hypothetical protein
VDAAWAQVESSYQRRSDLIPVLVEAVRDYNAALEQLPTRSFAQARGYERRAYFQTDESNRHASSLGFD